MTDEDALELKEEAPEQPPPAKPKTRVIKRRDPITQRFSRVEVDFGDRRTGRNQFYDDSGRLRAQDGDK